MPTPHRIGFYARVDSFPPILCRLLARRNCKPLTTAEIASKAGLYQFVVETLSQKTSWDEVDVVTMRRFTKVCGVDFDDAKCMRRVEDYLRSRPSFQYLRCAPNWKDYYLPMLLSWRKHYGKNAGLAGALLPPVKSLIVRLSLLKQ